MCWQCHENGWHSPSQFSNTNVCRPDRTANTAPEHRPEKTTNQHSGQRSERQRRGQLLRKKGRELRMGIPCP